MFKGGILHAWRKKMAVVVHSGFFRQLPELQEVDPHEADIVWLVYDLVREPATGRLVLTKTLTTYTAFATTLDTIAVPKVGKIDDFVQQLQKRIKNNLYRGEAEATSVEPSVEPMISTGV